VANIVVVNAALGANLSQFVFVEYNVVFTPASQSLVTHCAAIGYTLPDCNSPSWEIAADNAMRAEFPSRNFDSEK